MDLSMIENPKGDPRNANGSFQRLVKRFVATLKGKVRGRIGVGSEETKRLFKVAVEELMVDNRGKALEWELNRLEVEILSVVSLVSSFSFLTTTRLLERRADFPLSLFWIVKTRSVYRKL